MDDAGGRVVGVQALVKESDLSAPAGETHSVPVLEPGGEQTITVDVTAPDGFSGEQAFNVNAFAGESLVGGVTLTVHS